jgi:outer membrane protein assembly factor BamD (BamD/ComL family)
MIIFAVKFAVKKITPLLWGVLLVFGLSACLSDSQTIPPGLSPEELVQRAQEASDRNRYSLALRYYEVLYDENRDSSDWTLAAEYEIAFIHYKQKKYPEAREELNALLRRYDNPDEALMPQQFKYLAAIVLQSIDEKEAKQRASQPPAATGAE